MESQKEKSSVDFILAVGAAVGFLAVLAALLFIEIPAGSKETVTVMVQALIGILVTIVGYRFGSSKSSKEKGDTITQVITEKKE